MLRLRNDEALREKIDTFIRRKEAKYPELTKPMAKHQSTYVGGYHKPIDPQPYILIGSR